MGCNSLTSSYNRNAPPQGGRAQMKLETCAEMPQALIQVYMTYNPVYEERRVPRSDNAGMR